MFRTAASAPSNPKMHLPPCTLDLSYFCNQLNRPSRLCTSTSFFFLGGFVQTELCLTSITPFAFWPYRMGTGDLAGPSDGSLRIRTDQLLFLRLLRTDSIHVEVEWFIYLCEHSDSGRLACTGVGRRMVWVRLSLILRLILLPSYRDIEVVISSRCEGFQYYIGRRLEGSGSGAAPGAAGFNFGCTSEDINNLAYARHQYAVENVWVPAAENLIEVLG